MNDSELADKFWQGWLSEGVRSENSLRRYTLSIVNAAHRAAQQGNYAALALLERMYCGGEKYCQPEPLLSTYEHGHVMLFNIIANASYLRGAYRNSWNLAAQILATLDQADLRRVRLRLTARPNSEVRLTALGLLAACYFEDQSLASQEFMQMIVRVFWQVANQFWENLKSPSASADYVAAMKHSTALWELHICAASLHLGKSYLRRSVRAFNQRHGEHLFAANRHFESLSATDTPTAWYWDFELAKLRKDPDATKAERHMCEQERLASARIYFGASALDVVTRHWRSSSRAS